MSSSRFDYRLLFSYVYPLPSSLDVCSDYHHDRHSTSAAFVNVLDSEPSYYRQFNLHTVTLPKSLTKLGA